MISKVEKKSGLFLINVVDGRVVIHSKEIESKIIVNLFSYEKMDFVVHGYIIMNSNYTMIEKKLAKGKYRVTLETLKEKKEKVVTV
jgi:hypothetical protein